MSINQILSPIIPMGLVTLSLSIIVTINKMGCFMYLHTESGMFCLGWQNWHGGFCGNFLWYVLSGCQKSMGCFSQDVLSYIHTMDLPKSIVSYQKEEYITTQRVNALSVPIPGLT